MISQETRNKWTREVEFLEESGWDECSDWECGFIEAMSIRLEQGGDLTFKQSSKLADIYKRVQEKLG